MPPIPIRYAEIVPEIAQEPNYEPALKALRKRRRLTSRSRVQVIVALAPEGWITLAPHRVRALRRSQSASPAIPRYQSTA